MVEFALIIPFFFVIFAAIVSFGMALFWNMSLINATREAARQGAMTTMANEIPGVIDRTIVLAAQQGGLDPAGLTWTKTCITSDPNYAMPTTTTSKPNCDWSQWRGPLDPPANTGGAQKGDAIRVSASYTFNNILPLQMKLGNTVIGLPDKFTLTSTVQFTIDGAQNK